jgi:hypothetical protein
MFFKKGNSGGFFKKGAESIHLGVKGIAGILDHPLTGASVAYFNPALGAGIASARATGLLEKLKR